MTALHSDTSIQPPFFDEHSPTVASGYVPHTPGYRRILAALFLAGIAIFAQLYAPQAVLPAIREGFEISAGQAGLIVSMGTIGLALGVIPWACVSVKIGRVRTMRVAIIVGSVLTIAACFSPTFQSLLVLRFLAGFAIGAVPALALSYLNAEVQRDFTAKAAGVFIAGNSIGGLLGRIVAGVSGAYWGWQGGLLAVSIMASFAAVAFVCVVPQARCQRIPSRSEDAVKPHPYRANFADTNQRKLFLIGFLLMGAFVSVYNYMGFRLQAEPYSLPPAVTSFLFVGLLAGTITSVVAAQAVSSFGRRNVVALSGLVLALGIALTLIPQLWAQACGLLLVTAGFFGGQSVASGWASLRLPQASTQAGAIYTLSYYLGGSLMGWLAGEVLEFYGWLWFALTIAILGCCISALAKSLTNPQDAHPLERKSATSVAPPGNNLAL